MYKRATQKGSLKKEGWAYWLADPHWDVEPDRRMFLLPKEGKKFRVLYITPLAKPTMIKF